MSLSKNLREAALCLALLLCLSLLLSACSGEADENGVSVPNGMQNAASSEASYYMFVPTGWIAEPFGENTMVTVSAYSSVSLSLTSFESEKEPAVYWEESRADFERVLTDFRLEEAGEKTTMDGLGALRYRFFGKYEGETEYGFMQCMAKKDGRLYVLTYTASAEEFAEYEKSVDGILSYFKFKSGGMAESLPIEITEGAPEGMKQISRNDIHEYRFFVPVSWKTARQDGLVSAYVSEQDKTSVSVTGNYPPTGVSSIADYFASMESDRTNMLADYRLISGSETTDEVDVAGLRGARYVYEGKNGGVEYRICQIFFVRGSNIYTLTYTATTADYDTHYAAFESILSALTFER
ncbi:MAG: hypothetical protein IJ009_02815 [Clostridia bacterium]|nr:hypothetical protein [Clostridia bacterium]